jgi:peptidyl-tRNA hydrolase
MVLDRFAAQHRIQFSRWSADGHVAQVVARLHTDHPMAFRSPPLAPKGTLFDQSVVLLKPMTFMNRSGRAVRDAMKQFHVPITQAMIVHDDIYTALVA